MYAYHEANETDIPGEADENDQTDETDESGETVVPRSMKSNEHERVLARSIPN